MRLTLLLCLSLSIILVIRSILFFNNKPDYQTGQQVILEQTLLDEPRKTISGQTFYINKIKIFAPKHPELHYGDRIKITGKIEKSVFSNKDSKVISKAWFVKNPKIQLVKREKSRILSLAYLIRQKVSNTFNKYLSKNHAGLLQGIVLGVKENLDKNFYEALKSTGVLHVVAASGMNVSMVVLALQSVFLTFLRRKITLIVSVLGIAFYAALSGLEPSIIRASIMSAFAILAGLLGRQNYSYLGLFLAGFILLIISPDLIQDVGFQLSFVSTLGIICLKPLMEPLRVNPCKTNSVTAQLTDDFTTTFSAQISTLPILVASFGSYQPLSILVNILILWTIPILMALGAIAAFFSFFAPFLSGIVLFLAYPFLLFFEKTVMLASSITKPLEIDRLPYILLAGYYLILLSVVLYFNKPKKTK